jgi:hypothetical protein
MVGVVPDVLVVLLALLVELLELLVAGALSVPAAIPRRAKASETADFSVDYGVEYFLSGYLTTSTSGSFLPGSASVTDPFSLGLPLDVTYTAADPNFLSAVPEPSVWAIMLAGLGAVGFKMRASRPKKVSTIATA